MGKPNQTKQFFFLILQAFGTGISRIGLKKNQSLFVSELLKLDRNSR
jgi:hypothetical protein